MAYPDSLLGEGEHVVVHRHPHWKMLVMPIVVLLVVVGGGAYLAALLEPLPWRVIGWAVLAVLGAVLVLWLTVAPLVRWRTTHFVVTTQRLMVREGVFSRSGIDIPMSRINSVRFRHTIVERMLGCGTLVVESASDEPLEFDDIPQVEQVHSLLYREFNDDPDDDHLPEGY